MNVQSILKDVKKEIKPSKNEESQMKAIIDMVTMVTKDIIRPLDLDYTISGSYIRDTWLSDKKEFDLFILFPKEYPRGELQTTGLQIGRKIMEKIGGKYEIAYAEHPYTKGSFKGFSIDIVPCYKLRKIEEMQSAVDRTPFHNEYMKKNITKKLSDEVRILKKFTKSIGVYGSDVKTRGFSGYLCEILILKYKSFLKLLKAVESWKPGIFIDIEKHGNKERIQQITKNHPLIAIDPTDPKRNVAAALSPDNFVLFVKMCEDFMNKPSRDFFFMENKKIQPKSIIQNMKKRGTKFIGLRFPRSDTVDDIIWSQIRRTSRRIDGILKDNEFEIVGSLEYADENYIIIIFEMEIWELPSIRKLKGPPLFNEKHSKQFVMKYRNVGRVFVEDNIYVAEIRRNYKTPEDLFAHFFRKKPPELMEAGIASKIAEGVSRFGVINQKNIEKFVSENYEFRKTFDFYLNKKFA
ncbi:MAG: CCA tRNA nucleotidyltransferase [Candidatus Aenigmarchaeota archaeon]|nr:CCA tRNA nucleotidyltransferase [Candidatus Aenigmarchaeota archaeon]